MAILVVLTMIILSILLMASQVHAWVDEHRSEISGELDGVEWEGVAHLGWNTGDGSGIHYTGSTLTMTDSTVHALRTRSRSVERCGILTLDTDWDEEWEASETWISGGSENGWAALGACGSTSWIIYTIGNEAEHRVWLVTADTDGGEHSAWVDISVSIKPPSQW